MNALTQALAALSAVTVLVASCSDHEGCGVSGDTRCNGNTVEYCAGDKWVVDDECGEVLTLDFEIEKWKCCEREAALCLPECERD